MKYLIYISTFLTYLYISFISMTFCLYSFNTILLNGQRQNLLMLFIPTMAIDNSDPLTACAFPRDNNTRQYFAGERGWVTT